MPSGQALRGFVGQRMAQKTTHVQVGKLYYRTDVSTLTAPAFPTVVDLWLFGSGGGAAGSPPSGGGGGGEGVHYQFRCSPSAVLPYSVGASVTTADGNDSTLTTPTGRVLRALGGKAGNASAPGNGGGITIALGSELHRAGGLGGSIAGGTGQAGSDGGGGGTGNGVNAGGGGGSGGFSSFGDLISGGAGGLNTGPTAGAVPGGGSYPATASGSGLLVAIFTRVKSL